MTRNERIHCLRAFGLYVKGLNFRQIGELFAAEENVPYYASASGADATDGYYPASIRRSIETAWFMVRRRCGTRWPRSCWALELRYLKGSRYKAPPPPAPLTPLEELLIDIQVLEDKARRRSLHVAALGLRNLRAALAYNANAEDRKNRRRA